MTFSPQSASSWSHLSSEAIINQGVCNSQHRTIKWEPAWFAAYVSIAKIYTICIVYDYPSCQCKCRLVLSSLESGSAAEPVRSSPKSKVRAPTYQTCYTFESGQHVSDIFVQSRKHVTLPGGNGYTMETKLPMSGKLKCSAFGSMSGVSLIQICLQGSFT